MSGAGELRIGASAAMRTGPVVWAAIIASTSVLLFLFQKVLWLVVPFLLALVIYYLLRPMHKRLVLSGVLHETAAIIVSGAAFAILGLLLVFTAPSIAASAAGWDATLSRYLDGGLGFIASTLGALERRFAFLAHAHVADNVAIAIREFFETFGQKYLTAIALTLAAWLPTLLLSPFFAFFLLRDGLRFKKFLSRAVPNAFLERSLYLIDQVDRTARLYFVGIIKLTALDAVTLALGLWLIGVSGAALLGIVTAVLAWVPYIGSIAGCVLVVLVAATDHPGDPNIAFAAIGLFILVRLLDDFLFMPLTIGRSLKLHPLITVLMIFVGGAVAGITGLLLVLPLLGVVMVIGETLGHVLSDPRLRARHAHAQRLLDDRVTADLH